MKSSAVLASLLFGSFAAAAPVDRRELAYKTEIVYETVVVFTTVYEDDIIPEATTTPAGYFYEQPKTPSSVAAKPTQAPAAAPAPAPAAPVEEKKPSSAPAVSPVYVAPSPAPVVEQPKPVVEAPQAPAPAASSAAPAPAPAASSAAPVYQAPQSKPATSSSGSDMTYKDVDMTIYDNNGGFGACGTKLYDTDMIVALAKPAWGESTYNSQTGEATNPWCGQKIKVAYNGNEIEATIMDLCPGCAGNDIDLSLAAWTKLTGMAEKTRLKASWSKIS